MLIDIKGSKSIGFEPSVPPIIEHVVDEIRHQYLVVSGESPKASALRDFSTLIGLSVIDASPKSMKAIIQERKRQNEEYKNAFETLDGMTAALLRNNYVRGAEKILHDQLFAVLEDLYPSNKISISPTK